ncbi:hypothetical protein H8356DRAFT_1402377 [Neocallimastix lanati (nom. inval.)]|nr:hypothetical protein H8356DRAFT_1402377 [Neocallimastix sp. JGI-2020a]
MANNNRDEAIKLLNKYLEAFVSGNEDVWLQIADLCLKDNKCQQAAYCIEYIILTVPRNINFVTLILYNTLMKIQWLVNFVENLLIYVRTMLELYTAFYIQINILII